MLAKKRFGRGADLKFTESSFVIIGFLPETNDQAMQMIGRSSRTKGLHTGEILVCDKHMNPQAIKDYLRSNKSQRLVDGA